MSEYWKSTPTYWCKFCTQYVKDTPLEKKNHEASGKHQNNIQRSLRELHKRNDREEREKGRAKAEVERLNGLVGGKKSDGVVRVDGLKDLGGSARTAPPTLSAAQQRKAHAEQLAALGVELPEALKREVTGVGGWETVSERVVEEDVPAERSLAGILKRENEMKTEVDGEGEVVSSRGVRKRKADEEEEEEREAERVRRKAWGSRIKMYPGSGGDGDGEVGGEGDLEVLLSGVSAKRKKVKAEEEDVKLEDGEAQAVKEESAADDEIKPVRPVLDNDAEAEAAAVKDETQADKIDAPPVVFFKKRKAKR